VKVSKTLEMTSPRAVRLPIASKVKERLATAFEAPA
jgi:hypothetical protein